MPHAYAADATEPWQSRDAVPTLEAAPASVGQGHSADGLAETRRDSCRR
jgi:hypothetical protein